VFPRFHQLDAVRKLVAAARDEEDLRLHRQLFGCHHQVGGQVECH
jgi:hypothetical protein